MSRFTLLVLLIWLANCDNISSSTKTREISSVVNTVGQIPCSAEPFHDVAMILWFKDSSGTPIYSYDARNEMEEPKHMTLKNDWGLRLYFRVWPSSKRPPALIIRDLQASDAGLYRCRIDYRNRPTTNTISRLKVVQPPTHLEIRDTSQSRPISDQQIRSREEQQPSNNLGLNDITFMGPYIEGQNVSIVCSAYGGLPMPEVIWYCNEQMVDNTYELVGNNYVTNELSITLLGRNHSLDLYTCQANNTDQTKPISHRVNFDVYLTVKHIEVEIPDQMTAGVQYNLLCRAAGAYPTVKMEFWKFQKRIGPKHQIKSDADNLTTFVLPFRPEISDDESIITCRAENPWISQKFVETSRKLHVFYSPIVILRFGSNKTTNLSEGESLLMECHVKANPQIHSTMWFHEGEQIRDDPIGGVRLNGMTLFIRHLSHFSGGQYWCEATNDIGKSSSNILDIVLNIAPKCASSETMRVSLTQGKAHHLPCNILAWPPDLNFYWTLNRSGEILPISSLGQTVRKGLRPGEDKIMQMQNGGSQSQNFSPSGLWMPMTVTTGVRGRRKDVNFETIRHQAVLYYEVKSEADWGIVGCWARNSYGKQVRPCLFQITPPTEDFSRERVGVGAGAGPAPEQNLTGDQSSSASSSAEDSWVYSENGTFLSKLHGSLGIILMGLLIFITATSLAVCLWLFFSRRRRRRRRRGKMSKEPSPSIPPTSLDTTNSFGPLFVQSNESLTSSSLNRPSLKAKEKTIEPYVQVQVVEVQVQVQGAGAVEGIRDSQALSTSNKSDQVFL